MIEPIIVITNNPMSRDKLRAKYEINFVDGNSMDVLKEVRKHIHLGHKLLTHPLLSSIKPNETPYRTVLIGSNKEVNVDVESLCYIEQGIHTTEKFLRDFGIPNWSQRILDDFSLIDYDLIESVLQ